MVFVQVGRAIALVNPSATETNDPTIVANVNTIVSAATDAMTAALIVPKP